MLNDRLSPFAASMKNAARHISIIENGDLGMIQAYEEIRSLYFHLGKASAFAASDAERDEAAEMAADAGKTCFDALDAAVKMDFRRAEIEQSGSYFAG